MILPGCHHQVLGVTERYLESTHHQVLGVTERYLESTLSSKRRGTWKSPTSDLNHQ